MTYDYLIVGAGLFGATFANKATGDGKKCIVIDKRPYTGGNLFCKNIEGVPCHMHGAHIFHTNHKPIWDFVNGLTEFEQYSHTPLAMTGGRLYNLPFNMNLFNQVFGTKTPEKALKRISEESSSLSLADPSNLEEQCISMVGKTIYEMFVKGYTEKQWGVSCTDLSPSIIKRIMLRFSYDNNYFEDRYQGIPTNGYNELIDKLLQGSIVRLEYPFNKNILSIADRVIYTGSLDEFFDYELGELPYRSLNFETASMMVGETGFYQGASVINHCDLEEDYTRTIEHKLFYRRKFNGMYSPITREYPVVYKRGGKERYYPINNSANDALHNKYLVRLRGEYPNVFCGGRLGSYRYYNMDQVIASAWKLYEKLKE